MTQIVIYLTSGSSWTVPSNWNSSNNQIECIGGGAGGGSGAATGGGGGGEYATITNFSATPGDIIPIHIGAGGAAATAGTDTWLNSTSTVLAKAGGAPSGTTGGLGGTGGVGSTTHNGGNGGNAASSGGSGGGGGAGGPNGVGGSGGTGAALPFTNGASGGGGGNGGGGTGGSGVGDSGGGGGGNNSSSSGGGVGANATRNGASGTNGGGGGGGYDGSPNPGHAGNGSNGIEWGTHGSGGGGGGATLSSGVSGTGGLYGGGGGGRDGGVGAQGIIVITYTPLITNLIFLDASNNTSPWTVPSDCTLITSVECVGGGGQGYYGDGSANPGPGGGGGEYAKKSNLPTTPGSTIPFQVGAGLDTWFSSSSIVLAHAGGSATSSFPAGAGGTGGVGDVVYSGGNGRLPSANAGGGAAGPHGAGGNAGVNSGSSDNGTVAGVAGGVPGNSGTQWGATRGTGSGGGKNNGSGVSGYSGGKYGGGNSGATFDYTTGPLLAPTSGLIVITYTSSTITLTASSGSAASIMHGIAPSISTIVSSANIRLYMASTYALSMVSASVLSMINARAPLLSAIVSNGAASILKKVSSPKAIASSGIVSLLKTVSAAKSAISNSVESIITGRSPILSAIVSSSVVSLLKTRTPGLSTVVSAGSVSVLKGVSTAKSVLSSSAASIGNTIGKITALSAISNYYRSASVLSNYALLSSGAASLTNVVKTGLQKVTSAGAASLSKTADVVKIASSSGAALLSLSVGSVQSIVSNGLASIIRGLSPGISTAVSSGTPSIAKLVASNKSLMSSGAALISRSVGKAISVVNTNSTLTETDNAEDSSAQTTYTWSAKTFAIGAANANRLVVVAVTARNASTTATLDSVIIGGIPASKIDESRNTLLGALSITSVWQAAVPTGTTATVSATFSEGMLRAGCDVWTVVGDAAVPTVYESANDSGNTETHISTVGPVRVPTGGGAIVFTSTIYSTTPTLSTTNYLESAAGVIYIGGPMYFASGRDINAGSKTYTSTWSVGSASTGVAVSFSGGSSYSRAISISNALALMSNGIASAIKSVAPRLSSVTSIGVASVAKSIARSVSIVSASVATLRKGSAYFTSLFLMSSSTASAVKKLGSDQSLVSASATATPVVTVGKSLSATSASVIGAPMRLIKKMLGAVSASAATIKRSVAALLAAISSSFAAITKGYPVILTTVVGSGIASLGKQVSKSFGILSAGVVSLSKSVAAVRWISTRASYFISSIVSVSTFITNAAKRVVGMVTVFPVVGQLQTADEIQVVPVFIIGSLDMKTHDPIDFLCNTDWQMTGPLLDANGLPLSLTGATINWRLDSLDGATNYITLSVGSGITIVDQASSTILVDASAAQTNAIVPGVYRDYCFVTIGSSILPMWTGIIRAGSKPA